jgi:hypothetical protein
MRRSFLVLLGLVSIVGCEKDSERTAFVEVTSVPDGLRMSVSVGFTDPVTFEAETPIARNVRSKVFCGSAFGPRAPGACLEFGSAAVKSGDPAGKRVTMCLTDAGKHECATGNDGQVSLTMKVTPE